VDGDANDLQLLLASAEHEVETLRSDPRLAPLQGKRGVALREHVLDLLGAVEHRIGEQPPAGAPQSVRAPFARTLRQYILVLRGAHAALPWLAATRAPTLNLGSLYMTEESARVLVSPEVDMVVVPNPDYMYSTTSWPFRAVIDATPGFIATATRRPIVLNYPLTDSDRLLVHPIFAHELGHASVQEHDLLSQAEAALTGDPAFVASFEAAVTGMEATMQSSRSTLAGTLRGLLRAWVEELLCDHLAIEVMGPAFLWAFAPFVVSHSYGDAGPTHPPSTFRVRLALDHLTRRGWRPYMDRVAPGITGWLDSIAADASAALQPPHFGFLRDELLARAGVLQDCAMARTGADTFDRVRAEPEADEAARLLDRLILPVGLTVPLEPRSILLGGWQEALRRHGDSSRGVVACLGDGGLQDLIGKAIEMSVVNASWQP
jgi:hypothetical protein